MKFFTRFLGWWAAISSLVAMGGTCPCCGNGLCPQGLAVFGILGALIACLLRTKTTTSPVSDKEPLQFARHDVLWERGDDASTIHPPTAV